MPLARSLKMVGGSFKRHFEDNGREVQLSTPSVMSGDAYVMSVDLVPDTLTLMFF